MGSSHTLVTLAPVKLASINHPDRTTRKRMSSNILFNQGCQTIEEVRQLHAQLVISGFLARPRTAGKLIQLYVSVSHFYYASLVFETTTSADVFAYNTVIRALAMSNQAYDSLLLYNKMLINGLVPDNYTYTFVFKACSYLNALFEGKQVHCRIIKVGTSPDTHVHSSLIHMYANSNGLHFAEQVAMEFPEENTLVKNSMISGYLRHGCIDKATKMFNGMKAKDTASWSAMVSGYTKKGMHIKALNLFQEMLVSGVPWNESIVVSALSACAQLGALDQGRWIHMYMDKIGANFSVALSTALLEMYAKCGSIECSYEVFRKMPRRDVIAWGAMISGFALHGQVETCFELFDEMVNEGISPNAVIFVSILTACSHAGYVEAGHTYFIQMVHQYRIEPSIEHYGCMVDLLGRAGRLAEAEELISSMPEEPNSIIWSALLAACRTYRDLERGKYAFMHLRELEPRSGDRYKLAGQMFAAAGNQADALEVRKIIQEKEMETTCGSSFIEIGGKVHEFVAGDIGHKETKEIYVMLKEIKSKLERAGFVARREEVLLDIEDEEKEEALSRHSERLAIAYGLLSTPTQTPIRVIKNLRVCGNCHSAIKLISRVFEREIVVRDKNRFHFFKDGNCSCKDYW